MRKVTMPLWLFLFYFLSACIAVELLILWGFENKPLFLGVIVILILPLSAIICSPSKVKNNPSNNYYSEACVTASIIPETHEGHHIRDNKETDKAKYNHQPQNNIGLIQTKHFNILRRFWLALYRPLHRCATRKKENPSNHKDKPNGNA